MLCPYSKSGKIVRTGRKLDTFEEYFAKHMNSKTQTQKMYVRSLNLKFYEKEIPYI